MKNNQMTVSDIRNQFIGMYKNEMFNEEGMLEIIGSSFIITEEPIFKELDKKYAAIELDWYKSQSLNVYEMIFTPKIWKQVADEKGYINSNYGWMVFNEDNWNQYKHVLNELKSNPNSRRGSMIYQRPSMHIDAFKNNMSEFTCTWGVDYHIRNGRLNAVVKMRSNDIVFGTPLDYNWQKYILNKLALDLNVGIGEIIWQASSLHMYPRHFNLIEKYLKENNEVN